MGALRSLLSPFPRLRNYMVAVKLYFSNPHLWIPAIKTILRTSKAKKIGITIATPKDTYIYFGNFNPSSIIIDVGYGQDAELSLYLISKYGLKSYGVDPTIKHQNA
jgi:hypothetical protein